MATLYASSHFLPEPEGSNPYSYVPYIPLSNPIYVVPIYPYSPYIALIYSQKSLSSIPKTRFPALDAMGGAHDADSTGPEVAGRPTKSTVANSEEL